MHSLKTLKNMYIVLTICLITVGIILLVWPQMSLGVLSKIFGIILIVFGITKILGYFSRDLFQLAFQFDFGFGIVSVILGSLLLVRTSFMIEILSICLGIFLILDATLKIQTAIDARKFGIAKWWLILAMAIVTALIGAMLFVVPIETASALTRLLGLSLCLDGVLNIIVVQSTVHTIKQEEKEIIDIE